MKRLKPKELQEARELAGLGQFEVGRQSGIERSKISCFENGHIEPTEKELSAILRVIRGAHRKVVQRFERLVGSEAA